MNTRRSRWKKAIPTITLTAVSFTLTGSSASAFFPSMWQVSPPQPTVTVVDPGKPAPPAPVVVPPVPPPVIVAAPPPPPVIVAPTPVPPVIVAPTPQPPIHTATPEPSTMATAIAGLTAAAGWAARRRKK